MLPKRFPRLSTNNTLFSTILVVNSFVWLFCISVILREIVNIADFSGHEVFMIWSVNFYGAVISIVVGAFLAGKFNRQHFLLVWLLFGIISSIAPLSIDTTMINNVLVVSALFSVSLGLGLPACMAMFADCTVVENRARVSGMMLLLIMTLGAFAANLINENIMIGSIVLAFWRGLALVSFFFANPDENYMKKRASISFTYILRERSFALYIIPWTMFSLVNHLSASISANIHTEEFTYLLVIIGNVLAGGFAIVGGFLSDIIGRKRITTLGFIMLGLGYAVLGVYPLSIFFWYFYAVVDGIAWGIFYVIFIPTIWGDLAHGKPSEKYYALGSLPYLLSNFLRLTAGPFIASTISPYAIFSFASFFLFLAVVPLMFAPETLPEKKIKERELKKYVEKAKKVREKYG
jgi:MFS family permease